MIGAVIVGGVFIASMGFVAAEFLRERLHRGCPTICPCQVVLDDGPDDNRWTPVTPPTGRPAAHHLHGPHGDRTWCPACNTGGAA